MEKVIFIIFALLTSCNDPLEQNPIRKWQMTFSNAQPVQFWVNGVETFNQKEVCGINQICFCQSFNCDDEIKIQFTDTHNINYYLSIFDSNGVEIALLLFGKVLSGSVYIYDLSLIPSQTTPSICDLSVQFKIVTVQTVSECGLYNCQFDSPIEAGDENAGFPKNWYHVNNGNLTDPNDQYVQMTTPYFGYLNYVKKNHSVAYPAPNPTYTNVPLLEHRILWRSTDVESATTLPIVGEDIRIRARLRVEFLGVTPGLQFNLHVLVTAGAISGYTEIGTYTSPPGSLELIVNDLITIPGSPTSKRYVAFYVTGCEGTIESDDNNIYINYFDVQYGEQLNEIFDDLSVDEVLAQSDCIDIKTDHACTTLIEYSNSRDFAGLVYPQTTPSNSFFLRIPALLIEDDEFPREQEDTELSNGEIVRRYNKLEVKRNLDIGFMPNYMHKKLNLILMHDQITINELDWIVRDPYEKVKGNKHYPLRRANVLLTDKDLIIENQL